MKIKFYLTVFFSFFILGGGLWAQQYTMKGGIIYSKMHTREISGTVDPLLNYYYEANYCYRFGSGKFWSVGFGYLGSGGTLHDYRAGLDVDYTVDIRFSNFIFPVKLKVSTEHRAHPRYYGFVGLAPAWMFDEDRELKYTWRSPELERNRESLHDIKNTLFPYNAQKIQAYALIGGGVYYKHIVLDISAMINTFNVYKEHIAPVSFNSGVIATLGVQISRARNKMW